jgi:hypothetical protein
MQTRFTMTRTVTVKHTKKVDKETLGKMVADTYGDPLDGNCTGFDAVCGGFDIELGPPTVKPRNKP